MFMSIFLHRHMCQTLQRMSLCVPFHWFPKGTTTTTEVSGAKFDTLLKGIDEIIKLYLDLW